MKLRKLHEEKTDLGDLITAYLKENGIDAKSDYGGHGGGHDVLVPLRGNALAPNYPYANGRYIRFSIFEDGEVLGQRHIIKAGESADILDFNGSIYDPKCFPKMLEFTRRMMSEA